MIVAELKDLKNIPVTFTLGSFDGLHKGHSILLNKLKTEAQLNGTKSLVISFYPHPRQVVDSEFNLKLLNDRAEKLELLGSYGIDYIHFINFTKDFSGTDYEDFYENYIFANLDVKEIIAGENHGFGRNRSGNNELLDGICIKHSVKLISVEPMIFGNKIISSTRIRNCIIKGNISEANFMLGYEYSIRGIICKGKGIGRNLGFHTANISLSEIEKVTPGSGVYITRISFDGVTYFGISDAGTSPTIGDPDAPLMLETHIFDFNENIYGKEVRVFFIKKIREEIKFPTLNELKNAIENDLKIAKLHIKELRAEE